MYITRIICPSIQVQDSVVDLRKLQQMLRYANITDYLPYRYACVRERKAKCVSIRIQLLESEMRSRVVVIGEEDEDVRGMRFI
jgi:hypothetical protein